MWPSEFEYMIYTITLNPSLDRTLQIDKIREDVSNRIQREHTYAGGKGIDVSKVLNNLGIDNTALGFVGGFAGRELEGRLLNEGIQTDFVRISGETRTNIVIHEIESSEQIAINASGPVIRPDELMLLIEQIESLPNPQVVTIGGSLPQGINPEIYRKIISLAKKVDAKVILDVSGEALRLGIRARPDVIKPNIHELSDLVGRELESMDEIAIAAREITRDGVKNVLVSMGARGILLVAGKKVYLAVPPKVEVENTIGAGDSSVAGFIYGMIRTGDLKKALIYAVAAGTATTLSKGTALCQKDEFERLVPQIKLKIISNGV